MQIPEQASWDRCFRHPDGTRVLAYLCEYAGLFDERDVADGEEALLARAYHNIVIHILKCAGAEAISLLALAVKENEQDDEDLDV